MNSLTQRAALEPTLSAEKPRFAISFSSTFLILLGIAAVFGASRWYLHTYAFTVGLDFFEPEFKEYWMPLLYGQLLFFMIGGPLFMAYLWFTRETGSISPEVELRRYMSILTLLLAVGIAAGILMSLFAESDAAWHQIAIRDTDFTPTHIVLFYFFVPVMWWGMFCAFMWVHTRLPDFRDRISMPVAFMALAPMMFMPTLGYNEWGHTFFYAEELFAAPIHWGFVVMGWGFFGVAGFLVQMLGRMRKLTTIPRNETVNA